MYDKLGRTLGAPAILLLLTAMTSFGDVMITTGNDPTFDVVHFNNGDASPPFSALTGTTTPGYSLDAIGTNIKIQGNSIVGIGGNLTDITFEPTAGFQNYMKLILNVDVSKDGQIKFSTAPNGVLGTDTFNVSKNGQNFFTITASNGQSIASLTANVIGTEIQDVSQVRVGPGRFATGTPEPGTIAMMLIGIGAVAIGRRHKKA